MLPQHSIIIYHTNTQPSLQGLFAVQCLFHSHHIDTQSILVEQKINQKWLKDATHGSLLIDEIGEAFLLANGLKVNPSWQSLQQRIVKAGKKSELLLKAMRLQSDLNVIDATAGFGHDSLILASTGAHVTMIEQQPIMYVLLQRERQKMSANPNWQKLLNRLTVCYGDSLTELLKLPRVDRVYLDPMFPSDSYKSAVGKTMQVLHTVTSPPNQVEEQQLLATARQHIYPDGIVIVKRPKQAPYLANVTPADSVTNEVIRFDSYLA